MKEKAMEADMLHGPVFKSMFRFAIPIFLSTVFQQMYNVVDTIIVGHTLGDHALAAVGAASPVYSLLMGFALGIGGGISIVTARSFGAGDGEKLKSSAAASVFIGGGISLVMTVISLLLLDPFLKVLNTPAEIFADAYRYAVVIMACTGISFTYNMCSGILQSVGNSVMPLIFLIVSSVLNIILDYFCILVLRMGVAGAAAATVVAQAIAAVLCLIYIYCRVKILLPEKRHFRFDKELYTEMLTQGVSMAMMHCLVSAGSAVMQAGINGLGTLVIAGHTAAQKLYHLGMIPFIAMITATGTFVSQNYGAGQMSRVRKGMGYSYLYNIGATALMTVIFWCFAPQMIHLISGSEETVILENGTKFLRVVGPCYFILGLVNNTRTALQSIGSKILPIFSSIIELVGKILFLWLLIPRYGYDAVVFCEPVIWCFMAAELLAAFWTNPHIKNAAQPKA